jgi:hypothetical protein
MEVVISGAEGFGPCRVVQYFPPGFLFRAVEFSGSDIFQGDNSLNIVWARMPAGKSVRVVYEVMPGAEVSGPVEIPGRFHWVNKNNTRISVEMPSVKNVIAVVPGVKETGRLSKETGEAVARHKLISSEDQTSSRILFRVQILTSSSLLTDQELMKRLGITFNDKVTVVQSGNLYRYQAGECPTYECARVMLERFTKAGTVGAFVTAFHGEDQITVEEARSLIRK